MSAELGLRSGRGPGIVLLHGFTQTPASLRELAAHAPDDGRAIWALALPGHHPDVPVEPGWTANIAGLAERIERCAGTGAHLIGYSLGARCVAALLCEHGDLAARATLVAGHPGLETEAERAKRRDADRRWIELLRRSGIEAFVAAWEALPLWSSQARLERARLESQRQTRLGHDARALASSLEHMGLGAMPCYRASLAALETPVELITGALDTKFTSLAASLGPPHKIIAGAGHNVPLEAPDQIWT